MSSCKCFLHRAVRPLCKLWLGQSLVTATLEFSCMRVLLSQTLALAVPWVALTQETPCSDSFHISFTPFSFLTPEVQTLEYVIILNIKYKN